MVCLNIYLCTGMLLEGFFLIFKFHILQYNLLVSLVCCQEVKYNSKALLKSGK